MQFEPEECNVVLVAVSVVLGVLVDLIYAVCLEKVVEKPKKITFVKLFNCCAARWEL